MEALYREPEAKATLARVRDILARQVEPPLVAGRVRFLARGSLNVLFRVDAGAGGDLVFRFPRHGSQLTVYGRELLALLGRHGLPVPALRYRGDPGPLFPYPFVGYRFEPGVMLTRGRMRALSPAARQRLWRRLGDLLAGLAAVPIGEATAAGCPDLLARDFFGHDVRRRLAALAPRDPETAAAMRRRYAAEPVLRRRWRSLTAMDLNPDNLLYDPASERISLIDVEGVAITHPISHYLLLARHYGIEGARAQIARLAHGGGAAARVLRVQLDFGWALERALRRDR